MLHKLGSRSSISSVSAEFQEGVVDGRILHFTLVQQKNEKLDHVEFCRVEPSAGELIFNRDDDELPPSIQRHTVVSHPSHSGISLHYFVPFSGDAGSSPLARIESFRR